MKSPAVYFFAGLLFFSAAARGGDTIADYLPSGKVTGHFMRVTYPARAGELFKKMQASLSENREWLAAAVKNNKPGEPLPYNERLGLTPDEYKEYLALSKQGELKEVLVRDVTIIHNNDDTISLYAGDDLTTLNAIRFDVAHNAILTPYGDLTQPKALDLSAKGKGGVFGPFTGLGFGMEGGEDGSTIENTSGRSLSIRLGKMANSNKRFIYYNVVVMDNGERTTGIDMILEY